MNGRFADETIAAEWLRARAFPQPRPVRAPRIGVEVELLALDASTNAVALYGDGSGPLGRLLDAHARRNGWCDARSAKGAPRWVLPHGGALTLEPGGQIEYSSPPHEHVAELLLDLLDTVASLSRAASDANITLLGVGIDPFNDLTSSPLQLETQRYCAMDAYFAARGSAGRRMMRQTAAVQLNVDVWHDAALSWRALNAMSPCVLALTANSGRYAGAETGYASYRAATWRELDATRTGLFAATGDIALEYARFALAAGTMVDEPFGAGWQDHLSTLFPEVRPRGWYELRTADALPPEKYALLILPIAAVLRDLRALHETVELLGPARADLLERAGRSGLADPELRQLTRELLDIASRAADRSRDNAADADTLTDLRAAVATSDGWKSDQRR